jgi:uncharacterized protein (DUF427 family)
VVVRVAGQVVADTVEALALHEIGHPEVQYIPRKDVDMALLERSGHVTHCPFKGVATHFSVPFGGARSVNAAWSYESPNRPIAQIKGHIAFHADRIDCIDEWEQTHRGQVSRGDSG